MMLLLSVTGFSSLGEGLRTAAVAADVAADWQFQPPNFFVCLEDRILAQNRRTCF